MARVHYFILVAMGSCPASLCRSMATVAVTGGWGSTGECCGKTTERSHRPSDGTRSRRGRDRKGARFVLIVERVPTIGPPDGLSAPE